ncbi:MAG: hypothetical protein K2V38_10930, partial [Gemmataceae bacterium]|nr:hypothetical protein [Gemmataceae bacterium]
MGHDRVTSMAMIRDGTGNTIALLETRADLGPWAQGGHATLRGFEPSARPSRPARWRRSPSQAASRLTWTDAVRYRILTAALRWLAVALVLRVLAAILSNYPDYFPPNFDSL